MLVVEPLVLNLAVALGIGLLIGIERERRKSEDNSRSPAGLRTFAITALAGGIAFPLGGVVLLATVTAGTVTADTVSAHTIITLSDLDLKSNVTECGGLDVVEQLRGIQWVWNSDGTPSLGVAAQEVQAVLPQLVFRVNSGLGVNYAGLMGVLINAVNDLSSELNHLKDELRAAVANSI